MTHFAGIACDGCGLRTENSWNESVGAGWVMVAVTRVNYDVSNLHFCPGCTSHADLTIRSTAVGYTPPMAHPIINIMNAGLSKEKIG